MAFIQRLGQLRSPVSTYTNLPLTGNVLGDVRLSTDTGDAYTWMLEATSGLITNWKKVTTSSFNDLVGAPTNTGLDIDNAVKVVTGLSINIAYLGFQIMAEYLGSIARMFDGVINKFTDESGIESNSNALYNRYLTNDEIFKYYQPDKGDLDLQTKLLIHGDGIQGSTGFVDLLRTKFINHGVITDTSVKKFGTGSLKFDGTNDYIEFSTNDSLFVSRLFDCLDVIYNPNSIAIDFWFYSNASGVQPIFANSAVSTLPNTLNPSFAEGESFLIEKNSSNKIEVTIQHGLWDDILGQPVDAPLTVESTSVISNSTWVHVAVQKNQSGYLELYINGVLEATSSAFNTGGAMNTWPTQCNLNVGKNGSTYLNGYLDEIRVSYAIRYFETFTPMTVAYNSATTPAPTPTIVDISAGNKTVTVLGNARMSGTNPLFGNASLYLDGINSYLSVPDSDPYTKLLLHFDNNVTDFSSSPKTVTNNNVVFNSVLKKLGTHCASFYETPGSYFSIPDSEDFNFGSGDFTIDCWYNSRYGKDGGSQQVLYCQAPDANNFIKFSYNANSVGLAFSVKNGGVYSATYYLQNNSWEPIPGIWYHIALVRNGSNIYIFVNGQSMALNVSLPIGSSVVPNFSAPITVGINLSYTPATFSGWMDEVRVSKGIARWTSNFTPPSSPYNQDWVLSNLGDTQYGSELVVNGNFDTNLNDWSICGGWGLHELSSGGYSGNCLKGYRNNASYAWSISSPISVTIGQTYELTAYYKAANSGQGVYIFPSNSNGGQEYGIGNIQFNNQWTKFTRTFVATASTIYINILGQVIGENGTYNLVDNVSLKSFADALNDYTVDLWIDPLSLTDLDTYIIGVEDSWKLTLDGTSNKYLKYTIVGGASAIAPIALSLETWQHVAIVQKDGTIKLYVNGVLGASVAGSATVNGTEDLTIGADSNGEHLFNGFIEEVRVSDNARWSATFTPPAVEYSSDSNTKLLLPLNVQTVPNMVLQSVGYVSNYVPTSARVVIFEEDIDVMEPNVDLKIEVSRDGGTTFSPCLIAKDQEFGDGTLNLFTGSLDLRSQPNGELLVWKLTTQNNKDCRIRGISLNWR